MACVFFLLLVFCVQRHGSAFVFKNLPKCNVSYTIDFVTTTVQVTRVSFVKSTITETETTLVPKYETTVIPSFVRITHTVTITPSPIKVRKTHVVSVVTKVPVRRILTTTVTAYKTNLNMETLVVTNYHSVFETIGLPDDYMNNTAYDPLATDFTRTIYSTKTSTIQLTVTKEEVETIHDLTTTTVASTRKKMVTITVCPEPEF
nr:uncharacterized protein LOC123756884 [Procambarus clarkii]